ncbi:pentapeptide repeat-containing protein [Streptomyces sp. NBC_00338]|uniref:pentapeptide repeat-containing protein n=1 Tax=Streptomyces sp. NBC_00338 TaxID=2975715 RepID=UPI00224D478F|nr:pentapeptide repeat-containing protein [Streptomyces sp. NBC_00338]MCX5144804.1 pentapeptide repeat-containing protein [Streptomyces sp. NBC_00338]
MSPTPAPTPQRVCGYGVNLGADFAGCPGTLVPGRTRCLAHVTDAGRDAYLAGLTPGADIDHRNTVFAGPLLASLLNALHDPAGSTNRTGVADFRGAQFTRDACFDRTLFSGDARFDGAEFTGEATFDTAEFLGDAGFRRARFAGPAAFLHARFAAQASFSGAEFAMSGTFRRTRFGGDTDFDGATFLDLTVFDEAQFLGDTAWFDGASFGGLTSFSAMRASGRISFAGANFANFASFDGVELSEHAEFEAAKFSSTANFHGARVLGTAGFDEVQFSGPARFSDTRFAGVTTFYKARFAEDAEFGGARFSRDAEFSEARFPLTAHFGPLTCAGTVDMSGAVFDTPVTWEIAAKAVRCERTRWESTATLRLRFAAVDLSHAVLLFPLAVTTHHTRFVTGPHSAVVDENLPAGSRAGVRMASMRGVDAAHLVLTDIDLADCLFTGAFHLDQLRLEGRCTFAPTPTGLHRRHVLWPHRWSRRRTLAEEHHWRAQTAGQPAPPAGRPPSPRTWRTGPHHPDPDLTPDPEDVATLYRQLRKAFEDGKNEPGAADFYYGEMEMRRHDRADTTAGERFLLWGYWLLSGYGLRASRALGWLLVAVAATVVLMMGLGLPDSSPEQVATGTVPAGGGQVTLTVDKEDPRLTLPVGDRFTGERADKAVQVVLNSVVFRASGQDLTTWGTYTEMVSRFTEPVLLALAVLALRSRIKR